MSKQDFFEIKNAFTLAETLITIGIIGVVAAMVIPVTMQNIQAHAWAKEKENFEMKINEAMNQMKTGEVLTGYSTSADFVDSFKGYMKLIRTCDVAGMASCFVPTFTTGTNKEITTASDLKTGVDFGKTTYTSPLVGIQFNNGIQGIVAYNPQCPYVDPYNNQAVATDCLSMVYDLNGSSKPNQIGKDIYTYHATISTCDGVKIDGICIGSGDISFTAINTCDGSLGKTPGTAEDRAYDTTGDADSFCHHNNWAGAKKACSIIGMHLATLDSPVHYSACPVNGGGELCTIYKNQNSLSGLNKTGNHWYWSGTDDPSYGPYIVYINSGIRYKTDYKGGTGSARCVK